MPKATVLVVEDESIVSKDIQYSLKKLGYEVIGSSATGAKAIELALELKPNIVLMDIMLKGDINGIEASAEIKKSLNIPIIFLTAYADENTLEKAKITEPYAYILKPFKEIDLHTSIEMALYKHGKELEVIKERDFLYNIVENKESNEFIFVKSNSKLIKLYNKDIYFVEALKDYVVINTLNSRYTIHSTMKEIEKKLPDNQFVRVHRSFIIRTDKIAQIEQPNIILENDKRIIPVGGSYKEMLVKKLNLI
ncbi:response regulator [Flavobacteriales bacterium]|mgnify:FL=1|nr:response regulator [Flavobacteriales bacterium]